MNELKLHYVVESRAANSRPGKTKVSRQFTDDNGNIVNEFEIGYMTKLRGNRQPYKAFVRSTTAAVDVEVTDNRAPYTTRDQAAQALRRANIAAQAANTAA